MAIARSSRYGWPFTLVMLDLDHFKTINDEQGHQAGDAVLRDLGERFRSALRFGDNAGRIGGDEFAMILPNTEPDLVSALPDRDGQRVPIWGSRIAAGHSDRPVGVEVVRWRPAPSIAPPVSAPASETTALVESTETHAPAFEGAGEPTRARLLAVLAFPDTD